MIRIFIFFAFIGLACAQNPGDPFTLIRLIRKSSAAVVNPEMIRIHRTARVPVDVVGLKSITGAPQVWLMEAHNSFASIEATDKALSQVQSGSETDAMLSHPTLVGLLRPGLSYRGDDAMKALRGARYFQITCFRTRPGTYMDFAEVIRIRNAAQDQVNLDRPELGYQIISGGESGTYVFLAPLPSLQAIDTAIARTWGNPDAAAHAAARQVTNKTTAEAEIVREQLLFRVDPRLSYVSEAFASGAPDFWNGK